MRHPHPMVPLRGADASVPGVVLSPDAAGGNPVTSSAGNAVGEASEPTPPAAIGQQGPVVLVLPEPPSANRWWRAGRGRMHLSHEAKAYKADAFQRAGVHDAPLFPDGEISVRVVWHRDRKAGDLDKRLGVLLDALQSIKKRVKTPTAKKPKATTLVVLAPGVYDNDSQVAQIIACRVDTHPTIPKGHVRVEVGFAL